MAIRKVLTEEDETLRKISKPVVDFDDRLGFLLDDMHETMIKKEGAGLAAVQVGVLKRAFVMHAGKEYRECINPKIIKQEGENKIKVEGCLSVPGKCGYVERPEKVWVEYQDRTGKKVSAKLTGFEAKCFCHESDHLDGILYIDKATKIFNDRDEYNRKKEKENETFIRKKPSNNKKSEEN
ncbi:MAG: peptide deformylase [Clostridia bacterium]|nr:peptide deformylase [Clostridia bacterium]